jgi:hypothetical protein
MSDPATEDRVVLVLPPASMEERIEEARSWRMPGPDDTEPLVDAEETGAKLAKSKNTALAIAATAVRMAAAGQRVDLAHKQRLIEVYLEIDRLRGEIAALRSGAARATLADSFRGTWDATTEYSRGDLAISGGSTWLAVEDVAGTKPGTSPAWKLFAQSGRDGRDRR